MIKNIVGYLLILWVFILPAQNSDSLTFYQILDSARSSSNLEQSETFAKKALEFSLGKHFDHGITESAMFLGGVYARQGKFQEGIDFYHGIIPSAHFDGMALSSMYNWIGIYHVYMGHYDSTEKYFLKALSYRISIEDSTGIGTTLNNLGNVNLSKSQLEKATEYYTKSLEIREIIQDSAGIASSTNNLGLVFYKRKMFEPAINYYSQALDMNRKLQNESKEALILNNLGNVSDEKEEFDTSYPYYQQALEKALKLEDQRLIAISSTNLGVAEFRRENFDKAEDLFIRALNIRVATQDKQGQAEVMNELASLKLKLGSPKEAIKYFQKSNNISLEIGAREITQQNFLGLSEAYAKISDFENAYLNQVSYSQQKDSILNEENQRSINNLIARYETQKKEQQIALQQAEISEQQAENQRNTIFIVALITLVVFLVIVSLLIRSRSQKKQALLIQEAQIKLRETQIEAALNSQESERKRFARDLHDGFGQMISVLNLNLKSLEKGETDRNEAFANSAQVLDDMYKELKGICFNLMPETLIKSGVIDALKEFAQRVNQTRKLMLEIDTFGIDERLTDLQEISIYRISQEWINNVLKYSDATKITLSLTKDEEELTLLIEDNGSGFDKNDLISGTGNGWKNMNSRANLIKGVLELDTTAGIKGSTLIVNAPIHTKHHKNETNIPA
ncbi:MAG: tetratricopeptide repeat protein [Cyclobacteriaceae bacterium]